MKLSHFKFLSDPIDNSVLKLTILKQVKDEIVDGILLGKSCWYPVIDGVPRMLTAQSKIELLQRKTSFLNKYKNKLNPKIITEWKQNIRETKNKSPFEIHQQKTADSFAYEWKNIYQENSFEKNNFFHFLTPFIKENDFNGKITVDIGCGSGRFTKWAALGGAKVAFGVDLGDSVEVAYEMTKTYGNVAIIQADIYALPLNRVIDIAYSIGVLHHIPKPKLGFLKLIKALKKNGKMLIWVYSRRHNNRAIYLYEPLRAISRHIPKPILYKLCYIPASIVHLWNLLCKLFKWKKMPFFYYENFSFNMKLNDAFDVLATPKSNYYYSEEIENWFKEAKLKSIKSFEHPEAGITCIGTYV
ncbi:MAG: class I SAM-dependent methyltransferase [Microgenomates group bacterium]